MKKVSTKKGLMKKVTMKKLPTLAFILSTVIVSCSVLSAQAEVIIVGESNISAVSGYGQTPTDESVSRLIDVMQVEEQIKQMFGNENDFVETVSSSYIREEDLAGLNARQRRDVIALITESTQELLVSSQEDLISIMEESYLDIAKQYYTQAEVDAQIEFYSSSVGQSILQKQPAVMQDFMADIIPQVDVVMERQMQKMLPELEQDILRIMK